MPIIDLEERKEYQKEYHKKWYAKNKEVRRKQLRSKKEELKQWFKEFKKTLSCNRCSENNPVCLDFHHIDSKEKELCISQAVSHNRWGKAKIIKEIEKCEILCANCHRIEHFKNLEA